MDILKYIIKHHKRKNKIEGRDRKALLVSLLKIGDKLDETFVRIKNALEMFKEIDKYIYDENIGNKVCSENKTLREMLKDNKIHWLSHLFIRNFRINISIV